MNYIFRSFRNGTNENNTPRNEKLAWKTAIKYNCTFDSLPQPYNNKHDFMYTDMFVHTEA